MSEPNNGQVLSTTRDARPRYTGERLSRERPKIYRQVVRLLGEGWSTRKICEWCHVTRETVRAVELREAIEIRARKKSIVGILSNVAELGAGRMEETISKVAVINMPTPEENAEREAAHRRLDEITRLLQEPGPATPERTLRMKAAILALKYGESTGEGSRRGETPQD